jgi:hypothetical protein
LSSGAVPAAVAVAVGLIALHVVDDRFVQPEFGTSASDHAVSGLAPLALLGVAAWAYRRLAVGARGWLSLALAALAAMSGVEAVYYGPRTGLSADASREYGAR